MSLTKKVCVVVVSAALLFIWGCGSQDTQQKTETKPAVEKQADHPTAGDGTKELVAQTTCPVMGGAIDKSIYVDKDGKRIYMCCDHCTEELTKNFDENVKKMAEKGEKPETL